MTSKLILQPDLQQSSQLSLQEMYKEPIPEDYRRYCKQLAFSLITAVTLLAVEIILFKTVGVSQKMIIGFSVAQGILAVIAIASAYFIRQMDEKQSSRRATTTETSDLLQDLISHSPNNDGLYELLTTLDQEGLQKFVLDLHEHLKKGSLHQKLALNLEAIRASIKANKENWKQVKTHPGLQQSFVKTIDESGIGTLGNVFDVITFVDRLLGDSNQQIFNELQNLSKENLKQTVLSLQSRYKKEPFPDKFLAIAQYISVNKFWNQISSDKEIVASFVQAINFQNSKLIDIEELRSSLSS